MRKYIELNRRFVEFDPRLQGEESDASTFFARGSIGWSEVLDRRCTVVISEAGTGKTAEFVNRAKILRDAKKAAFSCRLELMTKNELDEALDIGTRAELDAWRAGSEVGYFFLDSVDEAKLASPADFERAIIRFSASTQAERDRCVVVVSTRPNAWSAITDSEMLLRRLGLPLEEETRDGDGKSIAISLIESEMPESIPIDRGETTAKRPTVSVLQLAPLREDQIRTFAVESGVPDVETFTEAIRNADADVFATRPADLIGLIEIWNSEKRIGAYREVVEQNIERRLTEQNPSHELEQLAPDRARSGAEALAAAVTFSGITSIRIPAEEPSNGVSIDPTVVLSGWSTSEIRILLVDRI